MRRFISSFLILISSQAFAGPPVIWNGTNAKFLNSGSIQVPGLNTAGVCYADSTGLFSQLANGTGNQVLTINAGTGLPTWQNAASGFADPMTSIGDMIYRNSSNVTARLPLGTNGQLLMVNGSTGLPTWTSYNPLTTIGDMWMRNTSNQDARLPIGSNGQVLQVNGSVNQPNWITPPWMTDPMTTAGDIIIRNSSNVTTRLPTGTSGQVLTLNSSLIPQWSTASGGFTDPMTSVGDMIYRDNTNVTKRLPIGSNGQVLTVNSSGYAQWSTPATYMTNPMTTTGDIIYAGSGSTPYRLGIGTSGYALISNGSQPLWQAIPSPTQTFNAVVYGTGSGITSDSNNFYWDSTNYRLGLGLSGSGVSAKFHAQMTSASEVGLILMGAASQTGDLIQLKDSGFIVRSNVDSAGNAFFPHVGSKSQVTPTLAGGTGAGTSPTLTIAGGDLASTVTITTGTTPAASAVIGTVTFNTTWGAAPRCVFAAANAAAATKISSVYITSTTSTYVLNASTTALTASTQYIWNVHCMQ